LMGSGITKEGLSALMDAPKALEAIRYQIQNDPKEFVRSLERSDPGTGEKFLNSIADEYVDRYASKGNPKTQEKESGDGVSDRVVNELREQISRLIAKEQQRDNAAYFASVRQRYDARLDDLFGLKEVKDMGLPASELKNMRARIWTELESNPEAQKRVNQGNFVDVPKVFQSLIQEKVDDKNAAIKAEKAGRERVSSNAFGEFSNGPDSIVGSIDPKVFDS